jgi:hypothetical protein
MVSKRGKFLHRHPRPPVREEISNANGHVDIGGDQPFGEAMGSEAKFLMSNPFGNLVSRARTRQAGPLHRASDLQRLERVEMPQG